MNTELPLCAISVENATTQDQDTDNAAESEALALQRIQNFLTDTGPTSASMYSSHTGIALYPRRTAPEVEQFEKTFNKHNHSNRKP